MTSTTTSYSLQQQSFSGTGVGIGSARRTMHRWDMLRSEPAQRAPVARRCFRLSTEAYASSCAHGLPARQEQSASGRENTDRYGTGVLRPPMRPVSYTRSPTGTGRAREVGGRAGGAGAQRATRPSRAGDPARVAKLSQSAYLPILPGPHTVQVHTEPISAPQLQRQPSTARASARSTPMLASCIARPFLRAFSASIVSQWSTSHGCGVVWSIGSEATRRRCYVQSTPGRPPS